MNKVVNVIGAGLAGCECAHILASHGVKVNLYEMKPNKKSPAHHTDLFAELVCSNSLKSEEITNACGLLKYEMGMLGSLMMEAALATRVKAGAALAVDRDKFSEYITKKILENKNITVIYDEVCDIEKLLGTVVIATGPLTSDTLSNNISKIIGQEKLYFYDAAAPIILRESIDMSVAYEKDRWHDDEKGDYLNLPMSKEEYDVFYNELINARSADRHSFDTIENIVHFEGCMPIESMAKRGEKTMLFGPLKPVGLRKDENHKPYAVVQLRAENKEKTMYNMVGFQTSLAFPEQKRVFSLIPGLENAEFVRYGVMHKNTYINAPHILDYNFKLKNKVDDIYFAGQISGVEGYVESAASGLMVAYNILFGKYFEGSMFKEETMLGALAKYIATENKNFQPMNANFGIIKQSDTKIKDKKKRYEIYANNSLNCIKELKNELENIRRRLEK
ncbi:MAG: methylenetetrahydrofolate--tRNA-(uracil(54)-C(5))-methyltransferase (FADH(2)-oxidizing) TrmFO [Clostridia bacterium]|nr:methylenetetrahydrofolate--tRNA-(uracil(54)-C(5))-methyltransferase (FADH(2)-oxidizing) TrmFO [Clostridia bacterium]